MEGKAKALIVFLLFTCIVEIIGEPCELLESEEDSFSVRFETDRRGDLKSLDTIEVVAYYNEIIPAHCTDQLVLMMEITDGEYRVIMEQRQTKRDRKKKQRYFLWKVSSVVPCRTNRFRLVVGEQFIEAELPPADIKDMEEFEFKPGKLSNIKYKNDQLSWDRLQCATDYKVEIFNINSEKEIVNDIISETNIDLSNFDHCEEYEYVIIPHVGEFESVDDEGYGEFTRAPNLDTLTDLEIEVEPFTSSAIISWVISDDVSCVDKYDVQVCNVHDDDNCITKTVYDPNDEMKFQVNIEGLEQAMPHTVRLTAVYRGNTFYSDEKKQFDTRLDLDTFDVKAESEYGVVTISWPLVAIADSYQLYRQYKESDDWNLLAEVIDSPTFQSNEEPCVDVTYAISVVTSDMHYNMKESNSVTIYLDDSLAFAPEDLAVVPSTTDAMIEFKHLKCIDSYKISICDENDICSEDEEQAEYNIEEDMVIVNVPNLVPCEMYFVHVVPHLYGRHWQGEPLIVDVLTEELLEPPIEESISIEEWSQDSPMMISWENTTCATGYELFFQNMNDHEDYLYKVSEEMSVVIENGELRSCTDYEFQIVAVSGENRSADATLGHLRVGPSTNSLEQFEPNIIMGVQSLDITFPDDKELRCIDEYFIDICEIDGECIIRESKTFDDEMPSFSTDGLTPASDYNIEIRLKYKDEEVHLYNNISTTRLDMEGIELDVNVDVDRVHLKWPAVKGADEYDISMLTYGDGLYDFFEAITDNFLDIHQPECSTATYKLEAVSREVVEEKSVRSREVITLMNDTEPYIADDLIVDIGDVSISMQWNHIGPCVARYQLQLGDNDPVQVEVKRDDFEAFADISVDTLKPCKDYELKIIPVFINDQLWEAQEVAVQRTVKTMDSNMCEVKKVSRHAESESLKRVSAGTSRISWSPIYLIFAFQTLLRLTEKVL